VSESQTGAGRCGALACDCVPLPPGFLQKRVTLAARPRPHTLTAFVDVGEDGSVVFRARDGSARSW